MYTEMHQMYPKVKVRQEEDPPEFQKIYIKDFQSLSLSASPERKDGYTAPFVRVSKPHISSPDAKISARSEKVNRKVAEQNKPSPNSNNSSSVLRPRAVLSSPENDDMLGTKNKTKTEHSGLKSHNSGQNRHVKCKKSYEVEKRRSSWQL